MQRQRRDPCRLLLHLFGKGERNSVFVNGDQTETSGGEGVTQDIRDSRGDARQPPCRLGKHQIARLGLASVADGCVAAELLVPGTPARKCGEQGKSVVVQVDLGGRRLFTKTNNSNTTR